MHTTIRRLTVACAASVTMAGTVAALGTPAALAAQASVSAASANSAIPVSIGPPISTAPMHPAPSSTAPPSTEPSSAVVPAGTPRCTASALRIRLRYSNSGAGHHYYNLDFTNTASHTCYLGGFPGVSATDAGGRQLGDSAGWAYTRPRQYVIIAPGRTANAFLDVIAAQNFPPGCDPVIARYLKVYPPASTAFRVVPFGGYACGHTGYRYLEITRVAPGA